MNITTIIGARPQFIKAAMISRSFSNTSNISEHIVHTGQHYDDNMSAVFFDELNIPKPGTNLNVRATNHGEQTASMLTGIEKHLLAHRPSGVLVYGDTNSTLAGALAASKLKIPIFHVEAGLRSYNRQMPEEINRILTDHASDILFAPTRNALEQLSNEGIPADRVHFCGDVMFDAAKYYGSIARSKSNIRAQLTLEDGSYILATVHRAENVDNPQRLSRIINELRSLTNNYKIILPLHPRTKNKINELELDLGDITVISPLGFLDMVCLEMNSQLIITDSGGVQKEAFFHNKYCVTLRTETEWTELVECGWNTLFPPLNSNTASLREIVNNFQIPKQRENDLYGDGDTSSIITSHISNYFS
ncbi:UDP-N-acetylglucosamine 2-epimerase [Gammaproteobacteria bacterium 45_16_T64]|nr:UDP-N-acetylglucosamine 2-epimerase [Gammaproteobacteria bacterium 45_16_T64]